MSSRAHSALVAQSLNELKSDLGPWGNDVSIELLSASCVASGLLFREAGQRWSASSSGSGRTANQCLQAEAMRRSAKRISLIFYR